MPLSPEVLRQMGFIPQLQPPAPVAAPVIAPVDASLPGSPEFQDQQDQIPQLMPQTDAAIASQLPAYSPPFPPGAPAPDFAAPPPAPPPPAQQPAAPAPPPDQEQDARTAAPPRLPAAPAISRPSSAVELAQRAEQQQLDANQLGRQAVVDETAAQRARSAEELKAYDAANARASQIGQQLRADEQALQKTIAEKQAYLADRKKAVDEYQVDRGKHWNSMGLGSKIGWAIALALSEVGRSMQARGGVQTSPVNPVIAMLQVKREEAIQAQLDGYEKLKARRADAQSSLDGMFAQLKDRRAVASAMRAENDQMLANEIKHAIAKTADPLIRASGVKEIAKLEASAAKNAQEAADQAARIDHQGKMLQVDRARLAETRRSNLANEAETALHHRNTEENARAQRESEAKKLEREGKNKEADLIRERSFGNESSLVETDPANVKPGDQVVKLNGKTYVSKVGAIRMKDGSIFIANGPTSTVADAYKRYMSRQRMADAVNNMLKVGLGYRNGLVNSDQYQEAAQLMAAAQLEALEAKGMGAPQAKDMEYAAAYIGTDDPNRFRDAEAGLNRALETMEREQQSDFKSLGLDKEWKAPWMTATPKAEPRRVEKLVTQAYSKDALERPYESPQDISGRIVAERMKAGSSVEDAKRQAQFEVALRERGVTQPDPQGVTAVKQLASIAKQGGDEGAEALGGLQKILQTQESAFRERQKAPPRWSPLNVAEYQRWKNAKLSDDPIYAAAKAAIAEITGAKPAPAPRPRDLSYPVPQFDPAGYDEQALIDRFQRTPQPTLAPGTR